MSGIAVRDKNGEKIHYTGSQFEGLENVGTRHLCIRTGSNPEDVIRYALTSNPLNDKYKALRMRIPDNPGGDGGKYAHIAQRYTTSVSESTSTTYTTTRVSNYVSSTTLHTASSSRLQTGNATRASTHAPIYYGSSPFVTVQTGNAVINGALTGSTLFRNGYGFTFTDGGFMTATSANAVVSSTKVTSYSGSWSKSNVKTTLATITYAMPVIRSTRMQTSRVSNYVSSTTLRTASSSRLVTGNATRASVYTTSSSASTTKSTTTHNADL